MTVRYRNRESDVLTSQLEVGRLCFDTKRPYGDGPWWCMGMQYTPSIVALPLARSKEECWDELHPGPPYKSGGPFDKWSLKTDWPSVQAVGDHLSADGAYKAEGGIACTNPPSAWLTHSTIANALSSGWGDGTDYGPEAWNKFRPAKPEYSFGQFIAEIREVPRMLMSSAEYYFKGWKKRGGRHSRIHSPKAANEWLNFQFGWRPFINDLLDMYDAVQNLDKRIDQLIKDNGQWIKRGGTVHKEEDNSVIDDSDGVYFTSGHNTYTLTPPYGHRRVTKTTSQHVWFRSRMRYYIPAIDPKYSPNARVKAGAIICGLNPSPTLVWELTPWSWLIDWFSNVGDNISNMDAIINQGLVAKYAYIMCHTVERVDVSVSAFPQDGGTQNGRWYALMERKQRVKASPFGFGLDSGDLSAIQWLILGAIGLSRSAPKYF